MPEPRAAQTELWGKLFCARHGVAKSCPKADGSGSRPAAFTSRKRTSELRQSDFGRLASAFRQGERKCVRFRAQGCAGYRSEEHTSELQSLMRISYAVFCLKKKNKKHQLQKQRTELHT